MGCLLHESIRESWLQGAVQSALHARVRMRLHVHGILVIAGGGPSWASTYRAAVDDFVLFLSRMRSKFSKRHDTRVCLANLFAWPRADQIRGGLTERARRGRRGRRAGERGARNAFVPLAHAQLDGVPVLPVLF